MTSDRRRLIADALGRSPKTIQEIDVGYDFEVAIVDDEWVFRFPRRSGVEEALELEIAVLPALARVLPVEVPSFELVSRDPLFVGYRLIRGRPIVDEDAAGVRAFLDALHAFDASGLPLERSTGSTTTAPSARSSSGSSSPSSTTTCANPQDDSSARSRRSSASSRCSSTPTSAPSTCSCAKTASPE